VIILTGTGLRRIVERYVEYYQRSRTHSALDKDAPVSRAVSSSTTGRIIAIPQVNGLHHRYERTAA
jgi:putative transposase